MASNDIKQPVRARKLETGKTYYPDELVEKDGELYVYSSDGSTSTRVNKSVKLLNSAKSEIGTIDPITGTDVTIPDATTSAPGLVKISTTAPKAGAANASVGTETSVARGDHVHPLQTSVSGNAGTADKLKTARSIGISGGITATAATFDGSKDVSINVTGIPASIVSGLGTVATSNSYNDLDNKPTIYGLAGTADTPKENGTAAVGTATRSARADHVHPLQTSVETATKDTDGDKFTEKYIKVRGSITDFNAATVEGIYTYSGVTTNGYRGSIKCYGTLVVHNTRYNGESGATQTWLKQIAYDTNYNVYYRDRVNTMDWTAWKTVALTSDIPSVVTATDSKAGITKIYSSTGSSTDGTMTRKAITDSLNNKAKSNHTHKATDINFADGSSAGSVPAIYESITGSIKNIFRYLPSEAIYVEYSKDGGTTWTEYSDSNDDIKKNDLTNHKNTAASYVISGPDTITTLTTNYKLRFTFSPIDGRYGNIKFFYIYLTTQGHTLTCDLERSTFSAKTTFVKAKTGIAVTGWSGPNIIDMTGAVSTFGGLGQANGYSVRLTFNITAVNASYPNTRPVIHNIRAYADPIWVTADIDYLATGLDYSIDNASKKITFPAEITATKINGRSTEANALADASGKYNYGGDTQPVYFKNGIPVVTKYTLGASVPADAKFTDTVYTHPTHTAKDSGLYKITVDSLGHVSAATAITKSDITGLGIASDSVMGAASASAAGTKGLVPAPTAGANTKFLRGDGTWVVPTDTVYTHPTTSGNKHIPSGGKSGNILKWSADGTAVWGDEKSYSNFSGASASAAGTNGFVPAPAKGDQAKFLKADGTWGTPTDTKYTHPTHTAKTSGMYKITVDSLGHISAATAITKSDITGLGIASDSVMTAATAYYAGAKGLVPAPTAGANTKFLRGDGTWQTIDTGTIVSGSTTATDGASVITNPLSVAISDAAQIYQNGILLTKNTHYTINSAGNIALVGYTAEDGDIFTVISKSTGADVSLNTTGANVALVNTAGYFDSANNVESAIAKIGAKLNGGVVSGVRVNGTIATPDSNGVVDVASPTIQVNGTTVTPSTTGVVNITNVVKTTGATMTGNLIAKSTSTGNHVRNISVYASDATLPTTGNDGDIVLVYSNS